MLVDVYDRAMALNENLGRKAREYRQSKQENLIPGFMAKKEKVLRYLDDVDKNITMVKAMRVKYQQEMSSNVEAELLSRMNGLNEKNSQLFKEVSTMQNEMKEEAKRFKNNAALGRDNNVGQFGNAGFSNTLL